MMHKWEEDMRKVYKSLARKPEGKKQLGRLICRWEEIY
jgi:hypothetical protein